jgi:GT2 family glycosyltransferase
MARDASDVTFTVLNFNGRELLDVILPSILAQTATGFRIHLLDNASTDGSCEHVAERYPSVRILRSPENVGVTRNMARCAASVETPYFALVNNDLELDPGWLEAMLEAIEAHPDAAAVDGKMLNFYDRGELDGCGDTIDRTGYPGRRGHGERDTGQYDRVDEVFCASGGAALYRRSAFDRAGTYDADFEAYYEDVDWGFRARLFGMPTYYTPHAVSFHMGSVTHKRDGEHRWAPWIVSNQIAVVLKNMPAALLVRWAPWIAGWQLRWLAFDVKEGRGRRHLEGLWRALRLLPRTLRKRRAIQRTRTASAADLRRVIDR